jgi:ornithine decarboxylase
MDIYPAAADALRDVPVAKPVILAHPRALSRAARPSGGDFPGEALYAVKAKGSPAILAVLFDPGIGLAPLRDALSAARLHCEPWLN